MAGVLAIDGGYNWRTAPVPRIRKKPRIPISHAALWFGGSLVRGFIRKHPYLSAGAAAAALGLGAYRYARRRVTKKMAETPRYGVAKRRRFDDAIREGPGTAYVNDRHHKRTKRLGRVNVRKLAREGVFDLYDRWQKMTYYGKQTGLMSFAKDKEPVAQDGSALTGYVTQPMYLWDLNCSRNNVAGTEYVPECAYQLIRGSNGTFYYNPVRGQDISTGVSGTTRGTSTYQIFQAPRSSYLYDSPLDNALLDWVKCQFVFYGSQKCSHKIWVDVCQMDSELQPRAPVVNLGVLPGGALTNAPVGLGQDESGQSIDGVQWYTNEICRLCDGPFATYGTKQKKLRFKILTRKTVEFTPVASYEEAGSALVHKQTLNLFLKMGRKCDFGWRNDTQVPSSVLTNTTLETDIEKGQHSCYVHPNARVFLMVRAQVFNKVGDDAAFTTDAMVAPSFDLRISRKWLVSG